MTQIHNKTQKFQLPTHSDNFYKNLRAFNNFNDLSFESNYLPAPSDWVLVMTDVRGSTQAIINGKYKDVNIIGAACISAVENILDTNQCPSIFGGDGCSILIPRTHLIAVKKALSEIRNSSKDKFGLDLRVCIIPVKELMNKGKIIKVAKFQLTSSKYIAKFSGGGLAFAEKLMKETTQYEMEEVCTEFSEFKNLSCRWQPIMNQNGKILTLIVQAKNFNLYSSILNKLTLILGEDSTKINPIKTKDMKYKSITKMLQDEAFFEKKEYSFKNVFRILEIIMCYFLFNTFRSFLPRFFQHYIKSMETHSDFRKFDDTLRMVVDCSDSQINEIEDFFSKLHEEGLVSYGTHVSDSALMTCLVNNLNDGGHIHFVDGNDGGYCLAAKKMKKQILNNKQVA